MIEEKFAACAVIFAGGCSGTGENIKWSKGSLVSREYLTIFQQPYLVLFIKGILITFMLSILSYWHAHHQCLFFIFHDITAFIGHRSRTRTVVPSPITIDCRRGQTVLCINVEACQIYCESSYRKRLYLGWSICFLLLVTNVVPSNLKLAQSRHIFPKNFLKSS